jgi:hypothetical protein
LLVVAVAALILLMVVEAGKAVVAVQEVTEQARLP